MLKTMTDDRFLENFLEKVRGTLYQRLGESEQNFLKELYKQFRFSHQELKMIVDMSLDLDAWQEPGLSGMYGRSSIPPEADKRQVFLRLREHYEKTKTEVKTYKRTNSEKDEPPKLKFEILSEKHTIFGSCPARSDQTVCCNLRTLDLVLNCGFGCSYCCIQTFSERNQGKIYFHEDLEKKLNAIEIDPDIWIHIGTGQASDSLMWGNQKGLLDHLCTFARKHPKVILELKSKSKNIAYFKGHDIPKNIFCAWSLNPQIVIDHEEHLTASLEERLHAARQVADRGIKVAFHLHPILYFDEWEKEYHALTQRILSLFQPQEVLFVSMGTLHFIKPVLREIRKSLIKTKVHQMPFVKNPEGKYTYPMDIKEDIFRGVFSGFSPWHDKIFYYLCMESHELWMKIFQKCYASNDEFEKDFLFMLAHKMRLC